MKKVNAYKTYCPAGSVRGKRCKPCTCSKEECKNCKVEFTLADLTKGFCNDCNNKNKES